MILPAVDKSNSRNRATADSAERRELKWPMPTDRYMLWIDGVGAWQLCVGTQFLIGGPTLEDKSAEIIPDGQPFAATCNTFAKWRRLVHPSAQFDRCVGSSCHGADVAEDGR